MTTFTNTNPIVQDIDSLTTVLTNYWAGLAGYLTPGSGTPFPLTSYTTLLQPVSYSASASYLYQNFDSSSTYVYGAISDAVDETNGHVRDMGLRMLGKADYYNQAVGEFGDMTISQVAYGTRTGAYVLNQVPNMGQQL